MDGRGGGGRRTVIGKYRRRARANPMMGLRYRGREGSLTEKKRKSWSRAGASFARAPRPFLPEPFVFETLISHISIIQVRAREQTELPPRAMSSAASSVVQGPSAPRATIAYCVSKWQRSCLTSEKRGQEQVKTADSAGNTDCKNKFSKKGGETP